MGGYSRKRTSKRPSRAARSMRPAAAAGRSWPHAGLRCGLNRQAELVSIDELSDDDWVATAAAIGAPASTTPWEMRGVDYVKAVQLLQEALGEKVSALMVGQNGKSSTLNGWLPSAILGTKVLDAVATCGRIRPATWDRSAWRGRPSR